MLPHNRSFPGQSFDSPSLGACRYSSSQRTHSGRTDVRNTSYTPNSGCHTPILFDCHNVSLHLLLDRTGESDPLEPAEQRVIRLGLPFQLGLNFLPAGALFFEFGFQFRLLFEYLVKPFLQLCNSRCPLGFARLHFLQIGRWLRL